MNKEQIAQRTAKHLIDIGAIRFNEETPFKLTSGKVSPVYVDCRKIISSLEVRRDIMKMSCRVLEDLDFDYIAGGETAGIPYAAWLSEIFGEPMLYVRKEPKSFGQGAQIEGDMKEGSRVLLVEDLTTDGSSKIKFVNALRKAGATVTDVFSIFYYDTNKEINKIFKNANLTLHYLTTWENVYKVINENKGDKND